MLKLAEQIVADILKVRMVIADDRVWVRYQNQLIPPKSDIFINVGMIDSQIISSVNTPIPTDDGMDELLQVIARENIQIDILSRDNSALLRRFEVIAALKSIYSEQQQEYYNFRIFPISNSFVNTSLAEGGSNINRFSITIACQTWYNQQSALEAPNDYYNKFYTRADDEKTIGEENGLFEFTIEEGAS